MSMCGSLILVAQSIRLERLLPTLMLSCGIAAAVLAVATCLVQSWRRRKRQQQIDKHHRLQYREWQRMISTSGELVPVETPLLLSKGEECFWFERRATLMEVRSVRHSHHTFDSVPLGDSGIRIGEAYGTSESTDEWRPIAEGQLYITNKQIYFDGDKHDRKISMDKIATLKSGWSSIEVSSTTSQKSMIFMGVNGKICQEMVHLLRDEVE